MTIDRVWLGHACEMGLETGMMWLYQNGFRVKVLYETNEYIMTHEDTHFVVYIDHQYHELTIG